MIPAMEAIYHDLEEKNEINSWNKKFANQQKR